MYSRNAKPWHFSWSNGLANFVLFITIGHKGEFLSGQKWQKLMEEYGQVKTCMGTLRSMSRFLECMHFLEQ